MRLTTKQHKAYKTEIISWITPYPEDEKPMTEQGKLEYFFNQYNSEAYENTKRYGSIEAGIESYLRGLPSIIGGMPFEGHEIERLAVRLGSLPANPSEDEAYKIISNFFRFVAHNLIKYYD